MRLYTVDLPIYERKCWSFGGESGNLRYLKAADRGSPAAQNHSSVLPVNLLIAVLLYKHIYPSARHGHLLDELERKQAVENALALANPKCGLVFCVFVSREAHLRDLVTREPERLVKQKNFTLPI